MADEHEHEGGLSRGHHGSSHELHDPDKKKHESWMLWALGLGAAGIILTLFMMSSKNGGGQAQQQQQGGQQGASTLVEPSAPFVPNPTDTSNGQADYWPYLMEAYYSAAAASSSSTTTKKKKSKKEHKKKSSGGHTGVGGTGGTTSSGGTHHGSTHHHTPAGKAHKTKTYGHSAVTHQPKHISTKVSGA